MKNIDIALVGDIMPGGLLHYSKSNFIDEDVHNYLKHFDLRVGTLECALGDDLEYYRSLMNEKAKNKNIIYAKNSDIRRLKDLNINVVTIANNHICDLGREGLKNTIKILKENNIEFCGAGLNIDEASKPAVVTINNKTIAFIGCAEIIPSSPYPASENKFGFNPIDIQKLSKDITKAKTLYDYVFILPHWGDEYTYFPPYQTKVMAYRMIDAGADGVFGGHSHTIQPHVLYKKKPIFFSMGNFLFPDRFVQPPAPTFYPLSIDEYKNVPESHSPKCSTVTLKKWVARARIGVIVKLSISNNLNIKTRTTKLVLNRKIIFEEISCKLKILLLFNKYMIKLCFMPFMACINLIRKTRGKLINLTKQFSENGE